ncbi:hypothetical protein D3C78_1487760 [compost metagenome]
MLQPRFAHALLQHAAGDLQRLVLQMAAADGVPGALAAHQHLRSGIARGGATLLDDGYQHAGFAALLQAGEGVDPGAVHCSVSGAVGE